MSDSDDTDLLILLPPDSYVVQSDSELDFSGRKDPKEIDHEIVNELVSQVSNLENRVSAIESLDGSRNTLSPISTVIQGKGLSDVDDVSDLPVDSCSALLVRRDSDNSVRSSLSSDFNDNLSKRPNTVRSFALERKGELLKDIDNYLKDQSGFSSPLKDNSSMASASATDRAPSPNRSPSALDLPAVEKLLREMELTQQEIEEKLKRREADYGKGGYSLGDKEHETHPYTLGDNIGSIPDLGFGIRNMFASESTSEKRSEQREGNKGVPCTEEACVKKDMYIVGSEGEGSESPRKMSFSTPKAADTSFNSYPKWSPEIRTSSARRKLNLGAQMKPFDRSFNSSYESQLAEPLYTEREPGFTRVGGGDSIKDKQYNGFKALSRPALSPRKPSYPVGRTSLLSLQDLWKNDEDIFLSNPKKLKQKLEEEKYRRKHLENTIQILQRRVLEEQEKLAVAIQVDQTKDKAIAQITEVYRKMVSHWNQIEDQRHEVTKTLVTERASMKRTQDDLNQKIARWEREVSQALDLAADYKGKCEILESELSVTKEALEERLKELEAKYEKNESLLSKMKSENVDLQKQLQISYNDYNKEKRDAESVRKELQQALERVNSFEAEMLVTKEQRDLLSTRLKEEKGRSTLLDQQKQALEEALDLAKTKEAEAIEARNDALSNIDKIKVDLRNVYQSQLEAVVKDKLLEFQSQLDSAQAAMQAEIEEVKRDSSLKVKAQQQAIINSHINEMRQLEALHKEENRALERRLAESEARCTRLENGKKDVAQKLHTFMEGQWQQALSIITSELTMRQVEGLPRHHQRYAEDPAPLPPASQTDMRLDLDAPSVASEDPPFNRDGQSTYRLSKPTVHLPGKQDQLTKYIQMLLEKQPGRPLDTTNSSAWNELTLNDSLNESFHNSSTWNHAISKLPKDTVSLEDKSSQQQSTCNGRKPPWKPS